MIYSQDVIKCFSTLEFLLLRLHIFIPLMFPFSAHKIYRNCLFVGLLLHVLTAVRGCATIYNGKTIQHPPFLISNTPHHFLSLPPNNSTFIRQIPSSMIFHSTLYPTTFYFIFLFNFIFYFYNYIKLQLSIIIKLK